MVSAASGKSSAAGLCRIVFFRSAVYSRYSGLRGSSAKPFIFRSGVREPARMLSDRCQTAVGMPPEYCLNAVRMLPVCPCRMLPAASEPPPELGRGFCDRVREFAAELRPWVLRSAFRNLQWKFRPCGFCQRLLPRAVSALRFRLRGPSLRSLSALSPRRDARSPRPARACRRRSPAPASLKNTEVKTGLLMSWMNMEITKTSFIVWELDLNK